MTSDLALGNNAFREKNYAQALEHYEAAITKQPELVGMIKFNIQMAKNKRSKHVAGETNYCDSITGPETIDIVVPVYNALGDVKPCLQSLVRNTDGFNIKVLVINDGSDAATTQWLREYCAGDSIFHLIEHPFNKGYTCSVNSGLRASTAQYVITQNSDTIVPAGWLRGMIRCMKSDRNIGVVGPLSNAASWQNVPTLHDVAGGFVVNDLPPGYNVDEMARLVLSVSTCQYPRLPFVNGFCFMIRRAVIDAIGYMDEENFPLGYGEENDFCIRVVDAGFELAIADDVFVFHGKSKSFGHERRKALSKQGTESLKRKHTREKYLGRLEIVKSANALDVIRARIQNAIENRYSSESVHTNGLRVLFLLPVRGGGGGAHSVVQEAAEMRRMGLYVRVAVKQDDLQRYKKSYSDISDADQIFFGFDQNSLDSLADGFHIVVATVYHSVRLLKNIVGANSNILPAYYVQDYEPMFFDKGSPCWQEARESYTLLPGAFLFAKTQWIIDEVKRHHSVMVHKVAPSIDHKVYKPACRVRHEIVHVAAMIRPQTPHRGAARTMRVLARLYQELGDDLRIDLFGCASDHPAFLELEQGFKFNNHGPLFRPQVASLLVNSDLFIDLSDYQAFGRTALEAMACGCAAVVPAAGGTNEYAVHDQTALMVDTSSEETCFHSIRDICLDWPRLKRLQHAGLVCASKYSVRNAAVSELQAFESAFRRQQRVNAKNQRSTLYLLPNRNSKGEPLGSAYVRLIYPYQSNAVRQNLQVKILQKLPEPKPNATILVQRHLPELTLPELRQWINCWKAVGGRIIYDIDDDLLDTYGLKSKCFAADVKEVAERVRLVAEKADSVIVSTATLGQKFATLNPTVTVIPNTIDRDLWLIDSGRTHRRRERESRKNVIRIGYMGTPTHDDDLNLVAPAMNVLEARYNTRIQIEVIGGFGLKEPSFGVRVPLPEKNDYCNFVRWLRNRADWDIAIVPLKDNNFNRSKSYLKFLESAALDTAIVVSDSPTYRAVARDEENCLLAANDTNSWVTQVSRLIENKPLRDRLSIAARAEVEKKYTTEEVASLITQCVFDTTN